MNDVQDRIAELEAENAELEQDSADAREVLGNQWAWVEDRDALAYTLSQVREWHNDIHARAIRQSDIDNLHRLLEAVPADLLREHDADVWDAAIDHLWQLNDPAYTIFLETTSTMPLLTRYDVTQAKDENPYRVKPEDEWVDPEPWFYPVSGVRTAHKLAYTNAEYRPRKVKPEDER